jgi:hypothetical protein
MLNMGEAALRAPPTVAIKAFVCQIWIKSKWCENGLSSCKFT